MELRYKTSTVEFSKAGEWFKIVRFETGSLPAKIELYRVEADGRETWLGYHPGAWSRRTPCPTCGVAAHEPCRSLGRLTTTGSTMQTVHKARRTT